MVFPGIQPSSRSPRSKGSRCWVGDSLELPAWSTPTRGTFRACGNEIRDANRPTAPAISIHRRVVIFPPPAAIYSDLAGGDYSRWTGNPRAAEAAVAVRVLAEVLLVVILGVIELRRRADLGGDAAIPLGLQRLLEGLLRFLR